MILNKIPIQILSILENCTYVQFSRGQFIYLNKFGEADIRAADLNPVPIGVVIESEPLSKEIRALCGTKEITLQKAKKCFSM